MPTWQIRSMEDYVTAYRRAQNDPDPFWASIAESFEWSQKWTKVQSCNLKSGDIAWFLGGQTNITVNALDRHASRTPDKIALIFEPNDPNEAPRQWTYKELLEEVCRSTQMLKKLGAQKGDRLSLYMPMIPELLFSMLACARLGVIHSVVFGGFSAEALATRIADTKSRFLITARQGRRGDKTIPLKATADEALASLGGHTVEKVIVVENGDDQTGTLGAPYVSWTDSIRGCEAHCEATPCDAEDPLFILYTSGSTGSPKGIVHSHAGYMVWAAYTFANVFQPEHDSVHWCTADLGWITGHSYITYGPLLCGVTTLMFEGIPTWPDPGRFWQVVDKHQVTHFYTAPTSIRALQTHSDAYVTRASRASLRVLGTVGEPINASAWNWYDNVVGDGRCPIVDTWWQTETGGIMIAPLAGITPLRPTFAGLPLPGISPVLVDDDGHELGDVCASGNLCVNRAWPGMMRGIHGNFERFRNGYLKPYPGRYFTGDGAVRDVDGMYRITGRVDDVLNVSGHRLGTAEIENAINKHPAIVESAVIGIDHAVTGQTILAFVVLDGARSDAPRAEKLLEEVREEVSKHIGAIAKPSQVVAVDGLPKTRSGKIMRRILRRIVSGERDKLGDTSTLVNPESIEGISKAFQALKS